MKITNLERGGGEGEMILKNSTACSTVGMLYDPSGGGVVSCTDAGEEEDGPAVWTWTWARMGQLNDLQPE